MGYRHLLLSPLPPHPHPPRLSLVTSRRRRAGHGAVAAAACSPSPSVLAAGRRAVLLVGVSVLPLLRLRDAAAAARPSTAVDLVTDRMDTVKTEETKPEEPLAEESQAEVKVLPAVNPLAGLLNAIAVIASGVLAGLFGASQREKEALQSTVSTSIIACT